MARRLAWLIPLVVILFARLWLGWGLVAAAIVAPSAALLGIGIGALIVWRRRRIE